MAKAQPLLPHDAHSDGGFIDADPPVPRRRRPSETMDAAAEWALWAPHIEEINADARALVEGQADQ